MTHCTLRPTASLADQAALACWLRFTHAADILEAELTGTLETSEVIGVLESFGLAPSVSNIVLVHDVINRALVRELVA